ncbi:MAG: PepSY-like domain-containing protein [Lewinellaceae bacterium]|nr:PepSY-like domain-containing protein [Lewinellaceae bacterium]
MKKITYTLLFAVITLLPCCRQDSADNALARADDIANSRLKSPVQVNLLPSEITDYVELNSAPFGIEDAFHTPGEGYEIWLGDGQELYFDERGAFLCRRPHPRTGRGYGPAGDRCMRGDAIIIDDLPAALRDYVAAHYPDAAAKTVVDKRGRLFAVELTNGVILLFNRDGSFIRECDGLDGADRRCMAGREARPAMLPQPAREYIRTSHHEADINKVVRKWNGAWAVQMSDGEILLFRPSGAFAGLCN